MNNFEFVNKLIDIATNYKTSYMLGQFGQPANTTNISRAVSRSDVNNKRYEQGALSIKDKGFMFDCVCLIKAVLWGWNGDLTKTYGGSKYASNGVPDIGADTMIRKCKDVSTDFTNIEIGEAVWLPGHIGVYVGNGNVVECTPKWSVAPGVKISVLGNIKGGSGMVRKWEKHGKIPYIDYVKEEVKKEIPNWAKEDIQWYIDNKYIVGDNKGNLNLTDDMIRLLVIVKRALDDIK